jgi:hypothetical protein
MQLHPFKIYRLAYFEEAVGILHEIMEQDGAIIALIGKIRLALPQELEQSLRPLIGQKISILRTDIPDKQYLFRVLAEEPNQENEAVGER